MYFNSEALNLLPYLKPQNTETPDIQALFVAFKQLQERLHRQMLALNLYLFPHSVNGQACGMLSVTSLIEGGLLCTRFLRAAGICTNVERLMGLEDVHSAAKVQPRRHPVIEIRLQPNYFAVEFVVSSDAWWDQENLMGRLSLPRHRDEFFSTIAKLNSQFCMGYWQGIALNEMRISVRHLRRRPIFEEWLKTFEASKDNLRIGRWYALDDPVLSQESIEQTLLADIHALYALYTQVSWTGENNFRPLYRKSELTF